MTEPPPEPRSELRPGPDRDAVLRRLRWEDRATVPCVVAFYAGLVLLTGRFAFWEGAEGWVAAGAVLVVGAVVVLARGRSRWSEARSIQVALRTGTDPGPELRGRADVLAAHLVRTRVAGWLGLLLPVGLIAQAPWGQAPVSSVLGAALVLVPAGSWAVSWDHRVEEAQRWVADPPGPLRPGPPESAVQRWARPRRLVLVVLGLAAAGFVAGLVVSLAR